MRNNLLYILTAFTIVFSTAAAAYAAPCALSIQQDAKNLQVTSPGGAKFNLENNEIKTVLPTGFDKVQSTSLKIKEGVNRITGKLKDNRGEWTASTFVVYKRKEQTDWFIAVNSDLENARGKWLVTTSIGNEVRCSESSSFKEVRLDESVLKKHKIHQAKLTVKSPGSLYKRLGL